ncbi:MAG: ATP-binding cassette domain-containing protein [Gaiellaceae bacterium]
MSEPAILAEGIEKRFGATRALAGFDLSVEPGTVLGLLGPNGAGKTTAVRIFTTLLPPDAGRARVAGYDVVGDATRLRFEIGLAGQYAAVDEYLSGRENLVLIGRLARLSKQEAVRRADELIERFGLADAATRLARTYSGGMRRRLDLAASLVALPAVIFLDEPTTGLDPRGRLEVWNMIGELVAGGITLLLTTQYMEEAERLADRIAVLERGGVIAEGTSRELKRRVGGERLEVAVARGGSLDAAADILGRYGEGPPRVDAESRHIAVPIAHGARQLADVIRDLDAAGIELDDVGVHQPTLDDVFLALTGHAAEDEVDGAPKRGRRPVA